MVCCTQTELRLRRIQLRQLPAHRMQPRRNVALRKSLREELLDLRSALALDFREQCLRARAPPQVRLHQDDRGQIEPAFFDRGKDGRMPAGNTRRANTSKGRLFRQAEL